MRRRTWIAGAALIGAAPLVARAAKAADSDIAERFAQTLSAHDLGAFAALFAEAYNAGLMTGSGDVLHADALADIIVDRARHFAYGRTFRVLRDLWSEWTYAWDHAAELRRAPE